MAVIISSGEQTIIIIVCVTSLPLFHSPEWCKYTTIDKLYILYRCMSSPFADGMTLCYILHITLSDIDMNTASTPQPSGMHI